MKKILMVILTACFIYTGVFAQDTLYVKADGNNNNSGTSETEPLKTLSMAFRNARQNKINKITVIGMLDVKSEGIIEGRSAVFNFIGSENDTGEILITGKINARENEKAILSAADSNLMPVLGQNVKIRFEHIEISGSSSESNGVGLFIYKGMEVTLGPGSTVKGNTSFGVFIASDGILNIDGGEVRENFFTGITVTSGGVLNMTSGAVTENTAMNVAAAGVYINTGGRFTITGGSITKNKANKGIGGVYVSKGAVFNRKGGNITLNSGITGRDPNIYHAR
ncbi:MAG: hypothetical protein FWB89_01635 [Treponema sp.]|nr:hypothetical protein [Treponema sp.]